MASKYMKVYDPHILKFDFFDTAVADILRAIDGHALMGSFVLSFCCIDYMGMAMNPSKARNTSSEFKQFVTDYLGGVESKYRHLADHMWAIRNSLIHVYGESQSSSQMNLGFSFSFQHPEYHLAVQQHNQDVLWLNLHEFVSELIAAIELFFRGNAGNDAVLRPWYGKLLIVEGVGAGLERLAVLNRKKPMHTRSHPCLEILDVDPPASIQQVRQSVHDKLLVRLNPSS